MLSINFTARKVKINTFSVLKIMFLLQCKCMSTIFKMQEKKDKNN